MSYADIDDEYKLRINTKLHPRVEEGALVVDKYVNDALREQMRFEEDVLEGAVVLALRAKGYIVTPPADNEDYREIFGRDPEAQREPIGALRLALQPNHNI